MSAESPVTVTIIRQEKCKQICDLNHTFSLNYLITALIFVLLHIYFLLVIVTEESGGGSHHFRHL